MRLRDIYVVLVLAASLTGFGAYYLHEKDDISLAISHDTKEKIDESGEAETTFAAEGMTWRMRAWKDENGDVPDNPIASALAERDYNLAQQRHPDGFSDGGEAFFNWQSRGPSNVGGRTRSMAVHPTEPILWVGSVGGGVWKSADGGSNWIAPNDTLQNFAIAALAIDPSNPLVLYAGTGEQLAGDGVPGAGIFKTTDGGTIWAPVAGTENWKYVSRIAVSDDGATVLASKYQGTGGSGIMKSVSGGAWTNTKSVDNSFFVAFRPGSNTHAVAEVVTMCSGIPCHKVIYTTNAGVEWLDSTISVPYGLPSPFEKTQNQRVELTYAKDDPDVVFAMHNEDCSVEHANASISRSTDGGQTFTRMDTSLADDFDNCQAGWATVAESPIGASNYNNAIWAWDQNLVIAGGTFLHRSTDGGNTVRRIAEGDIIHPEPHADTHCIVPEAAFDGSSRKTVYIGGDGGIYKTDNIETATYAQNPNNWQNLNAGYVSTQFYGAAGNGNTGLIYGGTQDNATLRVNEGSLLAKFGFGGDGGSAAVDFIDDNYCYGEYIGDDLHRSRSCVSDPNFGSVESIDNGIADIPNQTSFVNRFILDPHDPTANTMLYGGRSVWRTTNLKSPIPTPVPSGSPTPTGPPYWSKIRDNGNDTADVDELRITAIAIAPTDPDVIWVAESNIARSADPTTSLGRLYMTTNGTSATPSWTTIDDNEMNEGGPLPNREITRITIDPNNPTIVYVSFGGMYSTGNLWRRSSGPEGQWAAIAGTGSATLPKVPIRGIAVHPTSPSKLYAGTEIGVYVSENTGATWQVVFGGPSNVSIDEIAFMPKATTVGMTTTIGLSTKLLVATYGRGLFTTDVDSPGVGLRVINDFDGDGRSDIAVVRPAATPGSSTWHIRNSLIGYGGLEWGVPGDQVVPADFDGDGKTDIAVYRGSTQYWYWWSSFSQSAQQFQQGASGDIAVPGDYDGDDIADYAVFRPSTGYWYIAKSTGGTITQQWGQEDDIPFAADFDADGVDEMSVARLKNGLWYVYLYKENDWEIIQFGLTDDIPVVGDYDGDQKADVAVFRPSNGYWYFTYADTEWTEYDGFQFGVTDDVPTPGDFDGDGKMDVAVWRPSDGNWYIIQSFSGLKSVHFGASGDVAIGGKTPTGINARPGQTIEDDAAMPSDGRPARHKE